MEPIRARQATIDDLLERLLETGIILNLDLVIGVAGIPLIGINLKAAIAAVETMIEYGLMQDWDRDLRRYAARELQCKKLALAPGETVILDLYGSHWYSDGIYRAWRPGRLYLTDRRLVVYRQEPAEVLFQAALGDIQDLMVNEETYFTGARRDLLYLALASGDVVSLYAEDIQGLQEAIQANMAAGGRRPTGALLPFTREIDIRVRVKNASGRRQDAVLLPASASRAIPGGRAGSILRRDAWCGGPTSTVESGWSSAWARSATSTWIPGTWVGCSMSVRC